MRRRSSGEWKEDTCSSMPRGWGDPKTVMFFQWHHLCLHLPSINYDISKIWNDLQLTFRVALGLGLWHSSSHIPSEQCGYAAGDQFQGAAAHGDQRGEEEAGLPGGASEPAPPHGAGAHGELGRAERHQEHHPTAGTGNMVTPLMLHCIYIIQRKHLFRTKGLFCPQGRNE